jgi:four helix bundle protein
MSRDHRKLDAFKLADELALLMYQCTADFPPEERNGLRSQLRRAAVSIPTNLVEGSARESKGDYLRFIDIAFGSARESNYLISLALRLGYLDDAEATKLDNLGRRIQAALSALRAGLERRT